ncbi:hypothetical protein BH23CHL8_BH23CHL8_12550 [soil metagenome]
MGTRSLIRRLAVPLGLIVLAGVAPGPTMAVEPAAIAWTSPVNVRTQKALRGRRR